MGLYIDKPLAIKNALSHHQLRQIDTQAQLELIQATRAFDELDLIKSAGLFLESWRILQAEYESNLYQLIDIVMPRLKQLR